MRTKIMLVLGLIVPVVVFVLYRANRSSETSVASSPAPVRATARSQPAEVPAPPSLAVEPEPEHEPEAEPEPVSFLGAVQPGVEAVERARRSLELYKATMVYPPWSRPLDDSTKHLLDWNKPWPVGQPFAADKDRREIRVDVSLDKLFAGAGEPFTATVTVAYEQAPSQPVVPDQLSGRVRYLDGDWKTAAEVSFARRGDRYVATFTPSQIAALAARPREAHLLVHVQMGELFPKDLELPFQYAAADAFTVTGLAGDHATDDGSLEVALAVDVKHVAPTLIQAFLFDADGKRGVATYSDYFRPTALGKQQVPIKFFGKAIHDSRIDGRYRIVALNGHVKVVDAVPQEVFWSRSDQLPPLLTASAYSSSQFTHDAWTSAEKDAQIRMYEDLIPELGSTP